jgi:hypothetical protein
MRQKIREAAQSDDPYPKMVFPVFPELKEGETVNVKAICMEANKDLVRLG